MQNKSECTYNSIRVVLQTFPPFFSTSFCRICPTGWSIYQARLVWWSRGYATRLLQLYRTSKRRAKTQARLQLGSFFFPFLSVHNSCLFPSYNYNLFIFYHGSHLFSVYYISVSFSLQNMYCALAFLPSSHLLYLHSAKTPVTSYVSIKYW